MSGGGGGAKVPFASLPSPFKDKNVNNEPI